MAEIRPYNGLKWLLRRIAVYPKNGEYQLYVELMEAADWVRFIWLLSSLRRLAQEGLLPRSEKNRFPVYPKIGVITSPTGAAVRISLKFYAAAMHAWISSHSRPSAGDTPGQFDCGLANRRAFARIWIWSLSVGRRFG